MAETVTVHFATNREELPDPEAPTGFGPALNHRSPLWLRYGAAEMAPQKKGNAFGIRELRVAPENIPGVTDGGGAERKLGSTAVFDGLRERLVAGKADLVLLLHGYACDFATALSNAAELKTKWGTKARPIETAVFSWPADGKIVPWIAYASDRDDARSSAKAVARALLRFLAYLREIDRNEWCNANIHLVAHSMGNYVLRNAVQAMISDLGGRPLPRVFKTIFLMAADEDNDALEDPKKLARLPELGESVQVYFARNDRALTISDVTKGNPDRLGSTGPRTLTSLPQKVTLVDCAEVSDTSPISDARHQYYRKRAEVLADIRAVLAGTAPEDVPGREWIAARSCFRIKPAKR
ncbi:MAG: alpha/beta hydrolase [Acetobacteraceae bacterium]